MDYGIEADYGDGGRDDGRFVDLAGFSREDPRAPIYGRAVGRMAHDGYVNPVDQAWDSDWQVKHDDSGKMVSVAYKRRYCKECDAIIRRNAEGLLECSCGRIFSGGYDDWPITTRYIWGQKR